MDNDELLACIGKIKADVAAIQTSCANIEKRLDSVTVMLTDTDRRVRSLEQSRAWLWGAVATIAAVVGTVGSWIGLS